MKILEQAVLREWRWQLTVAGMLSLLGLALTVIFMPKSMIMTFFSLLGTSICLAWGYSLYQFKYKKPFPILYLLKEKPKQIVWIYSMVIQRMPFGFEFSQSAILYFKLTDGNDFTLSLPTEKLKLVVKYLSRLLPHAAIGYTQEREKIYLENPYHLLKV